jgi:hypothetical protein
LGGRASLLAYAGGLYINDQTVGSAETTGNFVRPGLGLEVDVGARLARRYIPYFALELGLMGAGHRFDNSPSVTTAHTTFAGLGFRFLAGDVNSVSFASDLSFGLRTFTVQNATGSWSAQGIEIFRLGLGAEVRVSNQFTLSPMVTLSGGTLTDVSGHISFAPAQGDMQTQPGTVNPVMMFVPFDHSTSIPSNAQTSYYAIVLGCGGHVDLFGK